MKSLGRLTALLLVGVAAVAVVMGVRSIPDIQRYQKMRNM